LGPELTENEIADITRDGAHAFGTGSFGLLKETVAEFQPLWIISTYLNIHTWPSAVDLARILGM
jgi:hypothetical protein